MATKLTPKEQEVFDYIKNLDVFKKLLNFMCTTACLAKKTKEQQREETMEHLRKCAKIMVLNPNIEPSRIYGWWFAYDGYRKPRNIILV